MRKRYWTKVHSRITELYLYRINYRQIKAILDRVIEWDCELTSLWADFQRMANKTPSPGLGKTLKVPHFDEAYTKLVESFK